MAPIKFEEHIKEKLENRRVKPSKQAWNRLSERLDAQENSKNNLPYWWLGIAASVVGVLFVVFQFWNTDTEIDISPKVVDTPMIIEEDSNAQIANEFYENDATKIENIEKTTNTTKFKTESLKKINQVNKSGLVGTTKNTNREEKDIADKPLDIKKENLSFEEEQIKNVVAQVQTMEFENRSITDADINALLEQAQKEIRLNNLINKRTGVVDANALLQDVEDDLDQSFRSKVFEALKSSYNSVKTAVAQRNN